MPCNTRLKPRQTIQQRAEEVRRSIMRFNAGLASGSIRVKVGAQGGIVFEGISEQDRDGVTDNCAYRRLMVTGSAMAKAAIQRAEQLAGRTVDRKAIGQGLHSHDGVWHRHKG